MCDWLGLVRRGTNLRLFVVCFMALLIPAPGLAARCWRRARNLQCVAQLVLTRLVPQPQGMGAALQLRIVACMCSIKNERRQSRY